ncbi:MAG: FAD-binding protein [Deltaproteobacteria bacterium]|nr:FAD-binding protein [Deltaproteobacteria bacterium]
MPGWYEALIEIGTDALKWPYSIRYDVNNELKADVLILGGGPAGCMAAISAARVGLKVLLVDKAHPKRSGGGSGVDHWLNTPNPCSKITPEECVEWEFKSFGGYSNGISRYIAAREGYDTLLELEKMGAKVRDKDDEFKGAPFRDEETKFLFAYDYENKYHFRVWGTSFKPSMWKECRRLKVNILGRVMVTGLLNEGGKQGGRIIGATGVNVRTGEFYIFKAKAVVDCMAFYDGNWGFSSELTGLPYFHPNVISDGPAITWKAGAEFTLMEKSCAAPPPGYHFPTYGTGNPQNTWFPCSMVDADGKPIPWVDGRERPIRDLSERTRPAEGQKFLGERAQVADYQTPHLVDGLAERIRRGEFKLPLYADLPGMPEYERKAIWGLMVGEEGRSRVPVLENYNNAGFEPGKDMLQSYFMLGGEPYSGLWRYDSLPFFRGRGPFASPGGLVTSWNLETNLEGLFAAGNALFAGNYYSHAAATGRYAGRKAAEYVMKAKESEIDSEQVERERTRVYAPAKRRNGMDWKELRAGLCRIMQNYCSEPKNDELLRLGEMWLDDIEANVLQEVYAPNPHILMRVLESYNMMVCDQLIIQASLARKASSKHLGFVRQDYPSLDPPDWHKFITLRQEDGVVKVGERPIGFWGDLSEEYEKHNKDYRGFLS